MNNLLEVVNFIGKCAEKRIVEEYEIHKEIMANNDMILILELVLYSLQCQGSGVSFQFRLHPTIVAEPLDRNRIKITIGQRFENPSKTGLLGDFFV